MFGRLSLRNLLLFAALSVSTVLTAANHGLAAAIEIILTAPVGSPTGQYFWSDYFGPRSYAEDDVIVTNQLLDDSHLIVRESKEVFSLTVDTATTLYLEDDSTNPINEILSVGSGNVTVRQGGNLLFLLPLVMPAAANLHTEDGAWMKVEDSITAPHGITASGNVDFDGSGLLTTPTLIVPSGEVKVDMMANINTVTLGDGIGGDAEYPEVYFTDRAQGDRQFGVTINSEARWDMFLDGTATSLHMDGGEVNLVDTHLTLSSIVTARPGLRTLGNGSTIVVEPNVNVWQMSTIGNVNLNGSTVTFDVNGAHGSSDGLRIDAPVVDGSIFKTGDGIMTLSGTSSNEHSHTNISRGGIRMAKSDDAIAFPSTVMIGGSTSTPDYARLISASDHQIADNALVSIAQDGVWQLDGHTERIGGLGLTGGQITAGQLSLGGDVVTVASSRTATIAADVSLGGSTRTFDISRSAIAASDLNISGAISNGTLVKQGAGVMVLSGAASNVHASTQVLAGTLLLNKVAGANPIGNDLVIGTLHQTASLPMVKLLTNDQIADTSTITMRAGTLDLNNRDETIGAINGSGGGGMSVITGTGELTFNVERSLALAGALVNVQGNINLNGSRQFDAGGSSTGSGNFTNWQFSGSIRNGRFWKTGNGRAAFTSVNGDALLDMIAGSASVGNAQFGGLTGTSPVDVTGSMVLNVPSGNSHTYSGVLLGNGGLEKWGPGTQQLAGTGNNTMNGLTYVIGGTLQLNKTGGQAIGGDLTVFTGSRVDALQANQFSSNSDVRVLGSLDTTAGSQSIGSLSVEGGQLFAGQLVVGGPVSAKDGKITATSVLGATTLEIDEGATFSAVGGVNDHGRLDSLGQLIVPGTGAELSVNSGFYIGGGFHAENGSRMVLKPGMSSDRAVLTIDGGFLVGTPIRQPFPQILLGMAGATIVDLSQSDPLSPGTYKLIDFSDAPYTELGVLSAVNPTLANFSAIAPPSTSGFFTISGNVLQFVSTSIYGDFNQDGSVDAADYVVWRKSDYSQADYNTWRANFDRAFSGSGSAATASIPEPGFAALLVAFSVLILAKRNVVHRGLMVREYVD